MAEVNGNFNDQSAERDENQIYLNLSVHLSTNSSQETLKEHYRNVSNHHQTNNSRSLLSQDGFSNDLGPTSGTVGDTSTPNCQFESESQQEGSISRNYLDNFANTSPYLSQPVQSPEESETNEKSSQSSDTIKELLENLPQITDILCLYGKNCKQKRVCKYLHYQRICSTPWQCFNQDLMNVCQDAHLNDIIKTLITSNQFQKTDEVYLQQILNYEEFIKEMFHNERNLTAFSTALSLKNDKGLNFEEKISRISKILGKFKEIKQTFITNISKILLEGLNQFKARLNIILHELATEMNRASYASPFQMGFIDIIIALNENPAQNKIVRLNKDAEWSTVVLSTLIIPLQFDNGYFFSKAIIIHPSKLVAQILIDVLSTPAGILPEKFYGFDFEDSKQISENTKFVFMTIHRFIKEVIQNPYLIGYEVVAFHDFQEDDFYLEFAFALLYGGLFSQKNPKKSIKLIFA